MKFEIYRALLLALGTFQTITNSTYLIKNNGISLARHQHKEIPGNVSDKNMKVKVITLLLFGIVFFVISMFSYITHTFLQIPTIIVLIFFALYAICEAMYYKYWKTIGFALISIVLLSIYIIL